MNPDDATTLEQIADEFLNRIRSGETPSIEEYAVRYPHLGDEMCRALRALTAMEQLKPDVAGSFGHPAAHRTVRPEKVGDYRIVNEIGRGGMGVVYEAVQESLGRRVALKVMPHDNLDERSLARFEREARAAARLHHTNIVPVYEIGQDGDKAYFAMQLIQGQGLDIVIDQLRRLWYVFDDQRKDEPSDQTETDGSDRSQPRHSADSSPTRLARAIISGQFQYEDLARPAAASGRSGAEVISPNPRQFVRSVALIGLQAADALSYAHARGIIHRDVKPSNVLLDSTGVVWITDFGLAKTDDDNMTRTGEILGTIRYMSPERFSGQCDVTADIYSLGLTLYELLVGRPAYESADRLQLIDVIHKGKPPAPRLLDRRIPKDLETIVLKAIDKNPQARYPSAKELANDLQRFVDDTPIRARRASTTERLVRWAGRNKPLAVSLAAVVLLLSLLAAVSSVAWFRNTRLLRLAQEDLYIAAMNLAGQASREPYGAETVRIQLSHWLPHEAGADLRGWEWYYLYALVHRERFVSEKLGDLVWSVGWSPDGTRFVASINNYGWKIWDAATGRLLQQKTSPRILFIAWSPDGTRLASTEFGGKVVMWNAATGQEILRFDAHVNTPVNYVAWSPNGARLATCSQMSKEGSMLKIWDASSGRQIQAFSGHSDSVAVVQWSPDAARLASASADGTTRIWSVATGQQLAQFSTPSEGLGHPVFPLCWNPEGTQLVTAANDAQVRIWDVSTKTEVAKIESDAGYVFHMSWRPNSTQLATAHGDGTVRVWDVSSGVQLSSYYGHTHEARYVQWNHDGTLLASCSLDQTVRVWDVEHHNPHTIIRQQPSRFLSDWRAASHRIDWNSSGDRLVSTNSENVMLWDLNTGEGHVIQHASSDIQAVAWSSDEQRIAFGGQFAPLRIWNASSDTVATLENESAWGASSMAWNHDGSRLAAGMSNGDIAFWDMHSNTKKTVVKSAHDGVVVSVDWNADGTRLATVGWDSMVKVWDPATSNLIWQAAGHSDRIQSARWSPDGTKLATAQFGSVVLWNALTGAEIARLDEIKEDFRTVDWSPDSTRLAVGSLNSVSVWDVSSGRVALRRPNRLPKVHSVLWSHDGTRLAVADEGGTIQIHDATIGYQGDRKP